LISALDPKEEPKSSQNGCYLDFGCCWF